VISIRATTTSRERDDGIHDREDEWLTLGRGPGSAAVRDGTADDDVRDRDDDWREERDRWSPCCFASTCTGCAYARL
jgi:hypothetical protein